MALALKYEWATGRRDLIAGLTVAAVALPQGIAYALIAGVDPQFGVYSAIVHLVKRGGTRTGPLPRHPAGPDQDRGRHHRRSPPETGAPPRRAVCIERLAEFLREEEGLGVRVLLAGVRPDTLTILPNVGVEQWFPTEQIFPEEEKEYSATLRAVRYAHTHLAVATAGAPGPINGVGRPAPPAYYLV